MKPVAECASCSLNPPQFITPFVPGINVTEVLNLHCNKHGLKKNPVYVKATDLDTVTPVEPTGEIASPPLLEDGFVVIDSGLTHGELDKLIEELVENSKHWPEYINDSGHPVICNPDPSFRHTLGGFSALVGLSSVYNKVSRRIKQQMHTAVIPVIREALEYLYGQDANKFYVRAICDRLLYRSRTNTYQGDAAHQDISPNFFEKILGSFLNMNPDHSNQTFSCFKGQYPHLNETFGPGTSAWAPSKDSNSNSGFVKSKIEGLTPTDVEVPFGKIVLFWSDIIHVVHKSSKKEILRMFEGFGLTLNRHLWIDTERVAFDLANLTPPKLPSGDEHSIYSATHASLQLDAVEKFFKETMNPCLAVCPYLPSLMYFVDHGILSQEDFEKYFGEFSVSEAYAYFYTPINQQ